MKTKKFILIILLMTIFTTKNKGTGLGLPIVNKIINEHSGEFIIKNRNEGKGVEIEILFPKINA